MYIAYRYYEILWYRTCTKITFIKAFLLVFWLSHTPGTHIMLSYSVAQKVPLQPLFQNFKNTILYFLQGVVVVEEVLRLKCILKLEKERPEKLIGALEKLGQKIPSREVMKSSKIGEYNMVTSG